MKASELRIGNYYNQFGNIHQVSWNTIGELEHAPIDQLWCKPIPLTEEWLLKFGFKKNQRDIRFKRLRSVVLKSTEKGFKFNYGESITYIHFVHQLQNLYFALNGNELTIIEKL